MNLIKGDIVRKLGTVYGSRVRGKTVLKAVPFSKAPNTELQTRNVRAFEALNRVSSAISRIYWAFLNLSDKKMLKHNAVAQWLKASISTHVFWPPSFDMAIPRDGTLTVDLFAYNQTTKQLAMQVSRSAPVPPAIFRRFIVLVFDEDGRIYFATSSNLLVFAQSIIIELPPGKTYWLVAFRTDYIGEANFVHGFDHIGIEVL